MVVFVGGYVTFFSWKGLVDGFDAFLWRRRRSWTIQNVRRDVIAVVWFAVLNRCSWNGFSRLFVSAPAVTWWKSHAKRNGNIDSHYDIVLLFQLNVHSRMTLYVARISRLTSCFVTLDPLVFVIGRTFRYVHSLSSVLDVLQSVLPVRITIVGYFVVDVVKTQIPNGTRENFSTCYYRHQHGMVHEFFQYCTYLRQVRFLPPTKPPGAKCCCA